MEKTSVDSMRE